jgi:hypothetical protein
VRNSLILPPNPYRNMNTTRILKNGGERYATWTNRYTARTAAERLAEPGHQLRDGAAPDESPYFCVA